MMLKISKTEAARRQIEAAIQMWFHDADPVSLHTLVSAASQIVHDLSKMEGIEAGIRAYPKLNPQFEKELHQAVCRYENFFKHANRDPESVLDFNPEATLFYLLDASVAYEALTKERPPLCRTLQMWFLIQYPQAIKEDLRDEWKRKLPEIQVALGGTSKLEFCRLYLGVLAQTEVG